MSNVNALSATPTDLSATDRLEHAGFLAVIGVAAALQFSIAIAQSLLAIAIICWIALVLVRHERIEVPRFFWPLLVLGGLTLVSASFSPQPRVSLVDSKQLVLFLIVPLTYRFAVGQRGSQILTVIVSVGAASAAFGIIQYNILHYDQLDQRVRGTLGHYMTYSGLLMLVIGAALARVLFGRRDRIWFALVMPALAVAVAVSFTRSAAVGICAAAALLFALKDLRLMAIFPIVAALGLALAPGSVTARYLSTFNLKDPTIRDRMAMLREGAHMTRTHPWVGVGPNMVETLYAEYRDPDAVERVNPHLHNVPVQIAAERGLPALVAWLCFVGIVMLDLWRAFRADRARVLAAAGLAAMAAMLAAGMFEYNFGDSEFQMMLLLLITLPFAAVRTVAGHTPT
jgi:O-antigen ligase